MAGRKDPDTGLTPQQEDFAQQYVLTGNACEALRRAYPKSLKWTAAAIESNASAMLSHHRVSVRIAFLKKQSAARIAKKLRLTEDDLVNELQEARAMAIEDRNSAVAITATMSKAKLLGMLVDQSKVTAKVDVQVSPLLESLKTELAARRERMEATDMSEDDA
jgi:phage terminase small subunit